jgi:hypothetical protein
MVRILIIIASIIKGDLFLSLSKKYTEIAHN